MHAILSLSLSPARNRITLQHSTCCRVHHTHRWFNITAAETDLSYQPIVTFKDGWEDTLIWFKANWLPTFDGKGFIGLYQGTEAKIATQVAGTGKSKDE